MPRSGEASRSRLHAAAIDLFLERGFDAVTTTEIAERAGVTERTYFRHFPDKREVLFEGENQLAGWVVAAVAAVPADIAPLAALRRMARAISPALEKNRRSSERLGRIIAATPALWERAAAKEAHLVSMLVELLRARGVDENTADLTARVGWGALAHAMRRWRANPGVPLAEHVESAFDELPALTAALGPRAESGRSQRPREMIRTDEVPAPRHD